MDGIVKRVAVLLLAILVVSACGDDDVPSEAKIGVDRAWLTCTLAADGSCVLAKAVPGGHERLLRVNLVPGAGRAAAIAELREALVAALSGPGTRHPDGLADLTLPLIYAPGTPWQSVRAVLRAAASPDARIGRFELKPEGATAGVFLDLPTGGKGAVWGGRWQNDYMEVMLRGDGELPPSPLLGLARRRFGEPEHAFIRITFPDAAVDLPPGVGLGGKVTEATRETIDRGLDLMLSEHPGGGVDVVLPKAEGGAVHCADVDWMLRRLLARKRRYVLFATIEIAVRLRLGPWPD